MAQTQVLNTVMTSDGPVTLQQRVEYNGDNTILYIGQAAMGEPQTGAGWTINTFTYNASQQMTLRQTALGAWSDRAILNYT